MKTASVFSAFNARWLEPEDVARSFVPTVTFKSLVKFQHSLLMGPRGCGKTTLLKMLTRRAQRVWSGRLKQEPHLAEFPKPDFEAIYIASDIRWSEELSAVSRTMPESPMEAERLQRALVAISSIIEASKVFESIIDENNTDALPLLMGLIRHLGLGSTVPSFPEVRFKLRAWLEQLQSLLVGNQIDALKCLLADLPPSLTGMAPNAVMRACTIFDEYAPSSSPTKWALCFDELEIAPKWLQTELFKALRSIDQRFLLKLTWSPLLPTDLTARQERQHDYITIRMWHGHVLDAKPFCKEFSTRFIRDKFDKRAHYLPKDVFGASPFAPEDTDQEGVYREGGVVWQAMVRLAERDPTFRDYLLDHEIEPENPISEEISVRDESLRKVKPLVLLREAFLSSDSSNRLTRRSRKNPHLYFGEDAIYAMSEGNPRLLAGLLNDLLDLPGRPGSEGGPLIRTVDQSRVLTAASQRTLAGIKAYPNKKGMPSKSLARLVDRMGAFLHSELVDRDFNPDPIGTFLIDPDLPLDIQDEITVGLLIGAFVHVRSPENDIPSSIIGCRIRLSYMLSPFYQVLFRNFRDIRLSAALRIAGPGQRSFFNPGGGWNAHQER
jgi:hypothetical protein